MLVVSCSCNPFRRSRVLAAVQSCRHRSNSPDDSLASPRWQLCKTQSVFCSIFKIRQITLQVVCTPRLAPAIRDPSNRCHEASTGGSGFGCRRAGDDGRDSGGPIPAADDERSARGADFDTCPGGDVGIAIANGIYPSWPVRHRRPDDAGSRSILRV